MLLNAGWLTIHMAHRLERANHQSGGDEQHDRQRNLRDDERIAGAVPLPPIAREPAPFLQRRCEPRPRILQHREQAEQQTGAERDSEGEKQDDRIDCRCRLDARQTLWSLATSAADARHASSTPSAACKDEREALGKQLPRDAAELAPSAA